VPRDAIRKPAVTQAASAVGRIAPVREWLQPRQRGISALGPVVMEGRDIGTVIFPDTPHKFFITASPDVRAARRLAQAGETRAGATQAAVAAEIAARDEADRNREVAPLRPAPDAVLINSDKLSAEAVAALILGHIEGTRE
jgi:cytidylate kinase